MTTSPRIVTYEQREEMVSRIVEWLHARGYELSPSMQRTWVQSGFRGVPLSVRIKLAWCVSQIAKYEREGSK